MHPFQDAQKLAIINARYFFPHDRESVSRIGEKLRDLIWHILTPNPKKRPSMKEIETILEDWNNIDEISLNSDAKKLKIEYFKRLRGQSDKGPSSVPKSGDLSSDDISKLQEKIRQEQLNKNRNVIVPLHDDYGMKMKHELYNKRGIQKAQPKQKQDAKRKVQFERKQSVSFEEETKQPSKNFWGDFDDSKPKRNQIQKKVQSTRDNNDSFDWDFDQSKQSNFANLTKIESKKSSKDPFEFRSSAKTQESDNNWFDDFDVPKAKSKPADDSFDFGEPKPKKERSRQIQTSYFEDFGFQDDKKVVKKQTAKPKTADFLFDEPKNIQKLESDDEDDLIELEVPKKFDNNQEDLLFGTNSEPEDLISLTKEAETDDLIFGSDSNTKIPFQEETDEDILFGSKSKSNENAGLLFDEADNGYDMIELNKDDGSDILFGTQSNTKSDENDIMSKLSGLYSESGLSSQKDDGILKPEKPSVLKQHEDQKQKFIPEVGEDFWSNLYGNDQYIPPPSQPFFQPLTTATATSQASSSVFGKSKPVIAAKKGKESNFKSLGIDYLLQTNIKR